MTTFARNLLLRNDECDPASWIVRVGSYLVGVVPEMHPFLEWAVGRTAACEDH